MESPDSDQRICRICMQSELVLDWNEELFDSSGMTYKDCYYKYTQLEEIVSDPFPQFLCGACSTDLQSFHLLIEKAIETQKILEQNLGTSFEYVLDIEHIQCSPDSKEFLEPETECVYIVENDEENEADMSHEISEIESALEIEQLKSGRNKRKYTTSRSSKAVKYKELDTEGSCETPESLKVGRNKRKTIISETKKVSESENQEDVSPKRIKMEPKEIEPPISGRNKRKCTISRINNKSSESEDFTDNEHSSPVAKSARSKGRSKSEKEKAPTRQEKCKDGKLKKNTPVMCTYCSKVLHNAYNLKKHEESHREDRARERMCVICGLKTFTSAGLHNHMKIHDKNREKKYKCEFCDKAFFDRGSCNIHRRIHLGQMVKCSLCPKEFFRQIDLDRHMPSHSSNPDNSVKSLKSKYLVHCKICNKHINSAKFNAHRAEHMNEPLVRCTLCNKDFFSIKSCTRHMQRVHKRTKDNYDDITEYYEKYRPRLSHVLMEQQEEVLPVIK